MGYRFTFDRALLRGIPEGGIVSQEEIEIQLGTREEFLRFKYRRSLASLDTALTSATYVREIFTNL